MKTLTLLIAISFSLCIFGCSSSAPTTNANAKNGNSSQAKNSTTQTNTSTTSTTNSSTTGTGKTDSPLANSLAGTWEMTTEKGSTMTFNKDGSFISNSAKGSEKGTYSVVDDETIKLNAPGMQPDTKFKVEIDDDTLNLTMDGMSEPMVLKRTK